MLSYTRTVLALVALLSSPGQAGQPRHTGSDSSQPPPEFVTEYQVLLSNTEDKVGLEAIRALHQQLDDDNDGTIEPSETGDFIKADLQPGLHESYSGHAGVGDSQKSTQLTTPSSRSMKETE